MAILRACMYGMYVRIEAIIPIGPVPFEMNESNST